MCTSPLWKNKEEEGSQGTRNRTEQNKEQFRLIRDISLRIRIIILKLYFDRSQVYFCQERRVTKESYLESPRRNKPKPQGSN